MSVLHLTIINEMKDICSETNILFLRVDSEY